MLVVTQIMSSPHGFFNIFRRIEKKNQVKDRSFDTIIHFFHSDDMYV